MHSPFSPLSPSRPGMPGVPGMPLDPGLPSLPGVPAGPCKQLPYWKKRGREEEVVGADNEKKAHNNICRVYCYLTSCFTFSLSTRGDKFLFVLHATQTPECCQSSNHHTQDARLYLFNQSYKQIQCLGAEIGAKTDVIQTKAKQQNKHTMEP